MIDPIDSVSWTLLVLRCQLGNRDALADLVAHCRPRLRGYLLKMTSIPDELNDLEQDVWADVFRYLPKLNNPNAFVPWMFSIARNRVFRKLRSVRPSFTLEESIEAKAIADDRSSLSEDDAQRVYEALDQITAEHREVILLRFIEDLSYEEIATVVGRPVGTVKSRIHNAKCSLRQILEREDRR